MIFSGGNTIIFTSSITDTHGILLREKIDEGGQKEREFLEKIGDDVRTDITKGWRVIFVEEIDRFIGRKVNAFLLTEQFRLF